MDITTIIGGERFVEGTGALGSTAGKGDAHNGDICGGRRRGASPHPSSERDAGGSFRPRDEDT